MKKTRSKPIIYLSKQIGSNNPILYSQKRMKKALDQQKQEEIEVLPRVFATYQVPLKVAIARKIKQYEQYNLNQRLANVDWKQGTYLDLKYFNYQMDWCLDLCTPSHIASKLIKGRAYDSQSGLFVSFLVTNAQISNQNVVFEGKFQMKDHEKKRKIDRYYICFDFEDPKNYYNRIKNSINNRNKFFNHIKYGIYIDCIDLEDAPEVSKQIITKITTLVGVNLLPRQGFIEISNQYKRCMNELLYDHQVLNNPFIDPQSVIIKKKQPKKQITQKKKYITLIKDNKKYKLYLKSFQKKVEQIKNESLFMKPQITQIMLKVKEKLEKIKKSEIFSFQKESVVLERFISEQGLAVGYFNHFMEEDVTIPLASTIRSCIESDSQGWFKIYKSDKQTYLVSKLRRLFILIQQNIKSTIKDHIVTQLQRFSHQLRKRIPLKIVLHNFNNLELKFDEKYNSQLNIAFNPAIIIDAFVDSKHIKLQKSKEKMLKTLKDSIRGVLKKVSFINSPQNQTLNEIFSMFKDEYGIQLEIPDDKEGQIQQEESIYGKVNSFQYEWITQPLNQVFSLLDISLGHLSKIEDKFLEIQQSIEINKLYQKFDYSKKSPKELVGEMRQIQIVLFKIIDQFPISGVDYGFFHIDFQIAKNELLQKAEKIQYQLKSSLLYSYEIVSINLQNNLLKIFQDLQKKPSNIYELVDQRQKLQNIETIIQELRQPYQLYLYQLCQENNCILTKTHVDKRWQNSRSIVQLRLLKDRKRKQYQIIKKDIMKQIEEQNKELLQIKTLFDITFSSVKLVVERDLQQEVVQKLIHLQKQYKEMKKIITEVSFKEHQLQLKKSNLQFFDILQEDFQVSFTLWFSIKQWTIQRNTWLNHQFGSFELLEPQIFINNILTSFKKIEKNVKKQKVSGLFELLSSVKNQIQEFSGAKLKLLKILKKDGFNRKHLQKVAIFLDCELSEMNLSGSLQLKFLEKLEEIEAVANDAWNQFYLQQTLTRVFNQLLSMKFEIIFYLDKKGNQIPLIKNYHKQLETIDEIVLNLQAIQYNPMKHLYEQRINELYEKSLYISKSLQGCQLFQKKFVELHPIFDLTDIVKQLPVENKQFIKVLRSWVELLKYMKKIVSIYDVCNGQNIHEKMLSMTSKLEKITLSLADYLQKKRQGFSRFHLLTDTELYELFASTSDMNLLNKMISKMFNSIVGFTFDDEYLTEVQADFAKLPLNKNISYKKQNLEEWLSVLQRILVSTIRESIEKIIKINKKKWHSLLNEQCSQALLICYEIEKTFDFQTSKDWTQFLKKQKKTLHKLIDVKKTSNLKSYEIINLGSLLVLSLYTIEKLEHLKNLNITDKDNFQLKRMMKIYYQQEQIVIKSFQTTLGYGYQYLGCLKRLVITNLTERMQLIFMSAFKNSLGGSAVGPAGTGKSQTTKDIARVCGKVCLIFNCSQDMMISSIIRIFKGMIVTGLWVCFDEFNRLRYQVLSMISQQLSQIFKYKSMGMRIDMDYDREVIQMKPHFHFCVTYNPDYVGRQIIPLSVANYFRSVAMVNVDKKSICKLLFFAKGFKEGDILAIKLSQVFEYSEELLGENKLYDFGLRSLISVIDLAGKLYCNQGNGQNQIVKAIKVLILPRMLQHHQSVFLSFVNKFFPQDELRMTSYQPQILNNDLQQILNVRLGIINLGKVFSGKTTAISNFQKSHKDWNIQSIYINALSINEIYGEMDLATRLWRDGILTSRIRQHIFSQSQNNLILNIKGIIYSEWIENLNSVLDNSRTLSLSCGEIMSIPQNLKIVINCTDLEFATPATITRSCIIYFEQKTNKKIIENGIQFLQKKNCDERQISKIIDFYEELGKKIQQYFKIKFEPKSVLNWILRVVNKFKLILQLQSFIFFLAYFYEGLLDETGKKIFQKEVYLKLALEDSIFDYLWDGVKWEKFNDKFKQFKPEFHFQKKTIHSLYVHNEKYNKARYTLKSFFAKKQKDQMLLLFGQINSGKTSIASEFFKQLPKLKYIHKKIYLTRMTTKNMIFSIMQQMLSKKTNKKKGAPQGKSMIIWIEGVEMPITNQYKFKPSLELLRLIIEKKGWYDYRTLEFQQLQDIVLAGDVKIQNKQFDISSQFLKSVAPIFLNSFSSLEIENIFLVFVNQLVVQSNKDIFGQLCKKSIKFYNQSRTFQSKWIPKYLQFSFIDIKKVIQSCLLWNLKQTSPQKLQQVIGDLFIFELERNLKSRLPAQNSKNHFDEVLKKNFEKAKSGQIFSLFQTNQSRETSINRNKCHQVLDVHEFIREVQCICDEYNLSKEELVFEHIVVYSQLCLNLCYITKSLSEYNSNLCLIGLPKCGKKILIKLANFLMKSKIYTVPNRFDQKKWLECIKNSTKDTLIFKNPSILLLQHSQLSQLSQKEDLNILLCSNMLGSAYSEADYEQLIYLFQSILIKKGIVVNRQNTIAEYIQYLKDNFHICLLLNPEMKSFRSDFIYYPSIVKFCSLMWMTQWPIEALSMISSKFVDEFIVGDNILSFLPQIHTINKRINKKIQKSYMWQGMFLDFLNYLKDVYEANFQKLNNKKKILSKSFNTIKETQEKLQSTKEQIKKLQPVILLLQKQTQKTIKVMNSQKTNAQSMKEQLVKKEKQISPLIIQLRTDDAQLTILNKEVEQQLKKAWENVYLVKQNHISEIKSLMNPTELIRIVIGAIVIIINQGNYEIKKNKSEDGFSYEENYFETGKKYILSKPSKEITRILTQYKKEKITKEKINLLEQKCLKHPRWDINQAKSANQSIFFFFLWVQAIVKYYRRFTETAPMRQKLDKNKKMLEDKSKEKIIILRQYEIYQRKVQQLTITLKDKEQKLILYREQIDLYEKMLVRGYDILSQIELEKKKWISYQTILDERQKINVGNSILIAVSIAYGSQHIIEDRNEIMNQVKQLITKNQIEHSQIPWILDQDQEVILKELKIYEDSYVLNNIKVSEISKKPILMIDPEEEGVNYMKRRAAAEGRVSFLQIDQNSKKLKKSIEQSILAGSILFIQVSGQKIPEELEFMYQPIPTSINHKKELIIGGKVFQKHSRCYIYLYTTSYTQKYAIQLVSKSTLINFTITHEQLQEKLIEVLVATYLPQQSQQYSELTKINLRDNVDLKNIEDKIMGIFVNMESCEDILKTQDTLYVLSTSNRLYAQIQQRIEKSLFKKKKLMESRLNYKKTASKISSLYFKLQNLQKISRFTLFSFSWFINLYQHNIQKFMKTICQELALTLPETLKIIPSIYVAELQFPQINFRQILLQIQCKDEKVLQRYSLAVGYRKLCKIVGKIRQSGIQGFQEKVITNPQLFQGVMKLPQDEVLDGIPNEFSDLSFYEKIKLINCFRPDCTVKLLEQWIKLNLQFNFKLDTSKYLVNTSCPIPLLSLEDDTHSGKSTKQQIIDLYDVLHPTGPSINFISSTNASLQKILAGVDSSYVIDQWIVIEGLGNFGEELILSLFSNLEEKDFRKKDIFRMWIIISQNQLFQIPEKYIKVCSKFIFSQKSDILKKITKSFMKQHHQINASQNYEQPNQKRYLISQLCMFHYMINQKSNYGLKSWRRNTIFTQQDLISNLGYLHIAKSDELRKILPQIVTNITYGGKLTDREDIKIVRLLIQDTMKNTHLERNIFWQSIWGDDKFPKSQEEYEHYMKNLIFKIGNVFKSSYQEYGVNSHVQNSTKLMHFQTLRENYVKSTERIRQNSFEKLSQKKLREIQSYLYKLSNKRRISAFSKKTNFRNFIKNEQSFYKDLINNILQELDYLLRNEDLLALKRQFMEEVLDDKVPLKWGGSTLISLSQWLETLEKIIGYINDIPDEQLTSYKLSYVKNSPLFFYSLYNLNKFSSQTHQLMWFTTQHLTKFGTQMLNCKTIKINNWYLWNAEFRQGFISPLNEILIEKMYYHEMPSGYLGVVDKKDSKNYKQWEQVDVYDHTHETGDIPSCSASILMPISKQADLSWILRWRVYLTLHL